MLDRFRDVINAQIAQNITKIGPYGPEIRRFEVYSDNPTCCAESEFLHDWSTYIDPKCVVRVLNRFIYVINAQITQKMKKIAL